MTEKKDKKPSGDTVQQEARAARLRENLRLNLKRRKEKARALKTTDDKN